MEGKHTALRDWDAIEHIKLYSDSLGELVKLSEPLEEEPDISRGEFEFLFNTLANDICRKCPRYRTCFSEHSTAAAEELKRILERAYADRCVNGQAVSLEFRKSCVYFPSLMEETSWLFRLLYQNRYWMNRFDRMKRMMRREIISQHRMLENCAKQIESDSPMDPGKRRRLNRKLFGKGCRVLSGRDRQVEDGSLEILLELKLSSAWKASSLAGSVSLVYQRSVICPCPEKWISAGRHRILFAEEGNFQVTFGKAHNSRTGENICGDTFSFVNRNHRQAVMCLSDGMGTGKRAFDGSSRLMEVLEAVLLTGISEETVMELLHSALYLQSDHEPSTLDIASFSLQTGIIKFIKAGGAATFIRRQNLIERISPESLPLGYLDGREYECQYKKLYDGDMVIMLSDGMLAFEGIKDSSASMENVIANIKTRNAQSFAEQLMASIPISPDGHDDDRTVLVAAVWEKGHRNHVEKH